MHHTFNPHRVVQQKSSEQCKGFLTVDCLLHEGNLLDCECNNIAWEEIKNALGVSRLQVGGWWIIVVIVAVAALTIITVAVIRRKRTRGTDTQTGDNVAHLNDDDEDDAVTYSTVGAPPLPLLPPLIPASSTPPSTNQERNR
ncbi:hypothetical protein KUCAC02_013293 [Chaenocephalus aceratus]|nr:hypothetical protein KUCAC02_013293 [Chaenocephalus aceratus]